MWRPHGEEGDYLSIDGFTGEVLLGQVPTLPSEVVRVLRNELPAKESPLFASFKTVMAWADAYRKINRARQRGYSARRHYGSGAWRRGHRSFHDRVPVHGLRATAAAVYSIAQTSDKFIWFGTQDGLNRFDGMKFTKVIPQSGTGTSLEYSKFFSALAVDQYDRLWTGTSEGIAIYDRYTNTFWLRKKYIQALSHRAGNTLV